MFYNNTKISIFAGAGGTGKTTLSLSYALALAKHGKKVGLLSIDPAKRLKSALGLTDIPEIPIKLNLDFAPNANIYVSTLHVHESLSRWIKEAGMNAEHEQKLFNHVYFQALSQKLATSNDTFAAIRIAEWLEKDDLDELVIDTAPGLHAVDFLFKPDYLMNFLNSKIIDWLKELTQHHKSKGIWQNIVKASAKKLLDGLSNIIGQNFILNFAELLVLLDDVLLIMSKRLTVAQHKLKDKSTNYFLISSIREDAITVVEELAQKLISNNMTENTLILNRTIAKNLRKDSGFTNFLTEKYNNNTAEGMFVNYANSYLHIQDNIKTQAIKISKKIIEIPISHNLSTNENLRIKSLCDLGEIIIQENK